MNYLEIMTEERDLNKSALQLINNIQIPSTLHDLNKSWTNKFFKNHNHERFKDKQDKICKAIKK